MQALQHPFLRKASTIESSKPMLGNSDDLLPADIKETDQLQADIAFKDTAEQERWRDLADTITQARSPPCTLPLTTTMYLPTAHTTLLLNCSRRYSEQQCGIAAHACYAAAAAAVQVC